MLPLSSKHFEDTCNSINYFFIRLRVLSIVYNLYTCTFETKGKELYQIIRVEKNIWMQFSYADYAGSLLYVRNKNYLLPTMSLLILKVCKTKHKWASSWENVSLEVSDQVRLKLTCSATEASMRLEILVTETKVITLSRQRKTKALIRLRGCAGWSAPLLFAYDIQHIFSWPGSDIYTGS